MISLEKTLLFIALSTMVCASPGPTVLFTLSNGITGNRKKAMIGLLGTASANIVWILCVALGVASIIKGSQALFMSLKYAGAAYLFYLGILSFRNKTIAPMKGENQKHAKINSVFCQGFLTSITNPKALLYYMAFLPQFVSGRISYSLEILYLGMCYIVILFLVLGAYIITTSKISSLFMRERFSFLINKVLGVGFIGASVSVIRSK